MKILIATKAIFNILRNNMLQGVDKLYPLTRLSITH